MPSYIQNEYAKETKPGTVDRSVSFKPLLFDPDAAENEERELTYPKGCMLKLKECEIEIALRKKGKVEMRAAILTDEDYNKVSAELVDPGFARLSLRKEKGDEEIIQYINKSKKKYKYLVSWL